MTATIPTSIQIRVLCTAQGQRNMVFQWTVVSRNQQTVTNSYAKGLGGYGRVVR